MKVDSHGVNWPLGYQCNVLITAPKLLLSSCLNKKIHTVYWHVLEMEHWLYISLLHHGHSTPTKFTEIYCCITLFNGCKTSLSHAGHLHKFRCCTTVITISIIPIILNKLCTKYKLWWVGLAIFEQIWVNSVQIYRIDRPWCIGQCVGLLCQ